MSAAPAISVTDLVKRYGARTVVDRVSLEVARGEIVGFLGPNGSGKTTTIRMMCGLLTPDGGVGNVLGHDILRDQRQIKREVGYMTQRFSFYEDLTIEENLQFVAGIFALGPEAVRDTLADLGLSSRKGQLAGSLSGGWKQRLALAACIMHRPQLLMLDEPTAGVDIELRQQLWDYVQTLNDRGVTVVLTTHYLEEAEELCDRIAIINHGKLIANKPTRELVDMAREKIVVVTLDADVSVLPSHAAFDKVEREGERGLAIHYNKDRVNAGEVLAAVNAMGHGIVDVSTREADLEDVFLNLTRAANG